MIFFIPWRKPHPGIYASYWDFRYSQGNYQKNWRVKALCEQNGLTTLLGVVWYMLNQKKNQCWQAEKLRCNDLICIFSK